MKNILAILSLFAALFVPVVPSTGAPQSQTNNSRVTGTLTDPTTSYEVTQVYLNSLSGCSSGNYTSP